VNDIIRHFFDASPAP